MIGIRQIGNLSSLSVLTAVYLLDFVFIRMRIVEVSSIGTFSQLLLTGIVLTRKLYSIMKFQRRKHANELY